MRQLSISDQITHRIMDANIHGPRIDNNSHIPDFVQAFSLVENGGLNMVL